MFLSWLPSKVRLKEILVNTLYGYGPAHIPGALNSLGLCSGDVLMLHASWSTYNGFRGRAVDWINALKAHLGPQGILSMPSLTYQNQSSKEFLLSKRPMDVRRSPSQMGLLSEVFRRGKDVRRSLSSTHPILAWGESAQTFLSGHEHCRIPFGKGSPFEKLLDWNGKILTLDAPFSTITYTHFLEDRIAGQLRFPFYEPDPMTGTIIDYEGNRLETSVSVISKQANRLRREERFLSVLEQERLIKKTRLGNTRLMLLEVQTMTECFDRWTAAGGAFFDSP